LRTAITEGIIKVGTVINDAKSGLTHMENEIQSDGLGLVIISTYATGRIDHELNTRVIRIEISQRR
jgi:hypothetical protein